MRPVYRRLCERMRTEGREIWRQKADQKGKDWRFIPRSEGGKSVWLTFSFPGQGKKMMDWKMRLRQRHKTNFKASCKGIWLLKYCRAVFTGAHKIDALSMCFCLNISQQKGYFQPNICWLFWRATTAFQYVIFPIDQSLPGWLVWLTQCLSAAKLVELSLNHFWWLLIHSLDSLCFFFLKCFLPSLFYLCQAFGLNPICAVMRSSRLVHNVCVRSLRKHGICWPQINLMKTALTAFISVFYFRVQFWITSSADPLLCVGLVHREVLFCMNWNPFWEKLPELHCRWELKCPPVSPECICIPMSLEYLWTAKWESAVQVTKLNIVWRNVSEYCVNLGTCAR